MNYRGRELDAVALWEEFVDFPTSGDFSGEFSPLVVCPNPEHGSTKRHFQVNMQKPLVHCFAACGISGTYERAISMIKGVSEREARKVILNHTRLSLGTGSKRKVRGTDGRIRRASGGTENALSGAPLGEYERFLPQLALEYLDSRGIDHTSVARYGIGWDPDDRRIVIPADDERGIARFLIKRAVRDKDWPKYLYAPEGAVKTAVLFGACHLDRKSVASDGLGLVEGSIDQIKMKQYGLETGAILGTGLSVKQVQIVMAMRPKRIVFMFDKDRAGLHNVKLAAARLKKVPLYVALFPRGTNDPGTLTKEDALEAWSNALPIAVFARRMRERMPGFTLSLKPETSSKRREAAYG